jgi:hypothetical protein
VKLVIFLQQLLPLLLTHIYIDSNCWWSDWKYTSLDCNWNHCSCSHCSQTKKKKKTNNIKHNTNIQQQQQQQQEKSSDDELKVRNEEDEKKGT